MLKEMLDQLEDRLDDLDRVFQALADPSRRAMVNRLSLGPASVSELAKPFAMSLAAVVQHVQVLEASGLVRSEKTGRVRTCQLAPDVLQGAERLDQRAANRLGASSRSPRPLPRREPGRNRQMTQRSVTHSHFTIERSYEASPARVFAAWATKEAKSRWFHGPDDWNASEHILDFRVGGHERVSGGPPGGEVHTFECRYHDIVPDERIVSTYEMYADDVRTSVSLAALELVPNGSGTKLTYTEHGAFLDGLDSAEGREEGTRELLANLARDLDSVRT